MLSPVKRRNRSKGSPDSTKHNRPTPPRDQAHGYERGRPEAAPLSGRFSVFCYGVTVIVVLSVAVPFMTFAVSAATMSKTPGSRPNAS